jgi:hypothetical protein
MVAKPVCTLEVALASWEARRKPDCPAMTRERAIACASTWSLLGSWRSLLRVSSSSPRKASAATSGETRSGSAKTMSKAMATAPSWVSRVTRSATTVRGQGHCPMLLRLASSISMMTTGRTGDCRGLIDW